MANFWQTWQTSIIMNATFTPLNTDSVDVRDVVSSETSLKIIRNDFLEQCPFCGSGTGPKGTSAFSFHSNGYKCFACDQTGDAIKFIERYFNITTGEAIRYFKAKYLNEGDYGKDVGKAKNRLKKIKDDRFHTLSPWTLDMFEQNYAEDNLTAFLLTRFDDRNVNRSLEAYQIRTSSGGTLFPYIDDEGEIRTVKMIKYLEGGGKRDRS